MCVVCVKPKGSREAEILVMDLISKLKCSTGGRTSPHMVEKKTWKSHLLILNLCIYGDAVKCDLQFCSVARFAK